MFRGSGIYSLAMETHGLFPAPTDGALREHLLRQSFAERIALKRRRVGECVIVVDRLKHDH